MTMQQDILAGRITDKVTETLEALGATPLEIAVRDLIIDQTEVFYGQLITRFTRKHVTHEDRKSRFYVPTCAVGIFSNDVYLIVNDNFFAGQCECVEPTWVDAKIPEIEEKMKNPICSVCDCPKVKLTARNRRAIVKHECQHIAHRHLTRRDIGDYEPYKANIAMDSVINEYNVDLPADRIDFAKIKGATSNQSWEQRYALLAKEEKENACPKCGGSGQMPSPGQGKGEKQENDGQGNQPGDSGQGKKDCGESGCGCGDSQNHEHGDDGEPCDCCGGTGTSPGQYGWGFDSHKFFGDADSETSLEVVDGMIKNAIQRTASNIGIGNCPQEVQGILAEISKEGQVNWRKILKSWIQESIRRTRELSAFRESLVIGGVFPGQAYLKLPEYDVYVDASGSIGMDDFNAFMTEVMAINRTLKATVNLHQWDTIIHKSEKIEKAVPSLERAACGGTDVECVKVHAKENKVRNLIVFTDGYFQQRDFKGFNLLWVFTKNHDDSHPGKRIVLEQ